MVRHSKPCATSRMPRGFTIQKHFRRFRAWGSRTLRQLKRLEMLRYMATSLRASLSGFRLEVAAAALCPPRMVPGGSHAPPAQSAKRRWGGGGREEMAVGWGSICRRRRECGRRQNLGDRSIDATMVAWAKKLCPLYRHNRVVAVGGSEEIEPSRENWTRGRQQAAEKMVRVACMN